MRLLQFFFVLIPSFCFSQVDSIIEYSRLEKMMMQPGSLLQIASDTIGHAGSLDVGALTAIDLTNGKKQRSVCFIAGNGFSSTVFSPGSLQIDIEELASFIDALTKMKQVIDSKGPKELSTYQYTFSNLVVLSMDNRVINQAKWDIMIFKRYKYLNSGVPGSSLFLRGKDAGELLGILTRYQHSLNESLYN